MNKVSELDLRMPKFRDPHLKLEDLEFDTDGQVVRKDRFESAMRKISGVLHGVNGLSPYTSWTCDQVIDATKKTIDELHRLKNLIQVVENAPDDAMFYHFDNKWYVKNIDQDAVEALGKDFDDLINFECMGVGEDWCENSAWMDLINSLVSISDIKQELALIVGGVNDQT